MAQQLEHLKWINGTSFMVDGFNFQNARCKNYFLTHFHSDHTTGGLCCLSDMRAQACKHAVHVFVPKHTVCIGVFAANMSFCDTHGDGSFVV